MIRFRTKSALCFFFAWLSWAQASRAAGPLRGFPVRLEGAAELGGPVAADIDRDGRLELLVATRDKLHALEADGNPVAGYPVVMASGGEISTSLTVGTLGEDGPPVVVFGTEDRKLAVLGGDGQPVQGFPLVLDGVLSGPAVIRDIDADGRSELVFATRKGSVYMVGPDGKPRAGYPASIGATISTAVTVGRFRPGSAPVLMFGDERGRLHARTVSGGELDGFPVGAAFTISSQPVLGDIDDDGAFEVVFGSKDFKIYAVGEDGSVQAGYPVKTGYRIYAGCALADLDGDGVVEVVAASGDGKVYALDGAGRAVAGFPVEAGRRLRSAPVVGDVDHDGRPEIAVGTNTGQLVLYRHNGVTYPGFPVRLGEAVEVPPLLVDLDGDGLVEVVALARDGTVGVWRMIRKGKATGGMAWPQEGRDAARRAAVYPNPPRYTDLSISPAAPRTADALELSYRYFDLDGDEESGTVIRWFADNRRVKKLDGARRVPPEQTRKHQSWRFTLRGGPGGPVFRSPAIEIENTPPATPGVAIGPADARTGDDLRMEITEPAQDDDGDKVRYRIGWLKDRVSLKGFDRARVPARHTAAGQRWTVVVTPHDGEAEGAIARASTTILNTPPTAPRVRLEPDRPFVTQDVRVVVQQPGRDPDGDEISYLYRWTRADQELNLPRDANVLPAGMVPRDATFGVEVTSFDGHETGGSRKLSSRVVNSPPARPRVRIVPATPGTSDPLCVEIVDPGRDPDHDPVHNLIRWSRKGGRYSGTHAGDVCLPAAETRKGQTWRARVTPSDGQDAGPPADVQASVVNTPPAPPSLEPVDARPATTDDLRLRLAAPATDADGDPVQLEVLWLEGDAEIARGRNMLVLPAERTRKNTTYTARVIPSDGADRGEPVQAWFEVQNTPPGPCEVAVEPAAPGAGQELAARVDKASTDADGDRVQMRYRWYRDGEPIESGPDASRVDASKVRSGQCWTLLATPFDGQDEGAPCQARVVVRNTPPTRPSVRILPPEPRTEDDLVVDIRNPAEDVDRDKVHYTILWQRDGTPYEGRYRTAMRLPATETRKGEKWTVRVTPQDGRDRGAAATAEVVIHNSPPRPPRVSSPSPRPATTEDLVVRLDAAAADPDGDPVDIEAIWYEAGREVARGADMLRLPAAKTRKNTRYVVELVPSDGEARGESSRLCFVVRNTPPTGCALDIRPARPVTGTALEAVVRTKPGDADGDEVRMRMRWYRDGEPLAPGRRQEKVAARQVRRDQRWTVVATPFDGEDHGPSCRAEVRVVNSPPRAPRIELEPATPTVRDPLRVRFIGPASDPDADAVRLAYTWRVDGKRYPVGASTAAVPAGALRKGQRWEVEVVASDGELEAAPVRSSVTVANTPPGEPQAIVLPRAPLSSEDLHCRLTRPTPDADRDDISHAYAWFLAGNGGDRTGGEPLHTGPVLPASRTRKGQRWFCRVSPHDGTVAGPAASASVEVANAAPSRPKVEIRPAMPASRQQLQCVIVEKSTDPDGDLVRYRFRWTKDGVAQSFAPGTDRVPARLTSPRDIWQCAVIASDGVLESGPAESDEVVVRDEHPKGP